MSKRKRGRQGKKKDTRHGSEQQPMLDRRAMEKTLADVGKILQSQEFDSMEEANAFLNDLMASGDPLPKPPAETALEKAQEIMYQAWEARGKKRVKLARKALRISEECADAYVLLAEETARSPQRAKELYDKGVRAGERALGQEMFEEEVGHFWGILETRPYMRARAGLAHMLWLLGQQDAAMAHLQDMLRLNPNDNQGLRYFLATCLLAQGRHAELAQLLQDYREEATASWAYTWALLAFRQEGASRRAKHRLQQAIATNPHVPAYLLGERRLPRQMPEFVGIGDENEAIDYAASAIPLWTATEGALVWLTSVRRQGAPTLYAAVESSFEVGDSVAMKMGERLEQYDLDMSGWQGWVVDVDEDGDLYLTWDSQTLQGMADTTIKQMIEDRIDWTGIVTPPETVEAAQPRDEPEQCLAVARARYADHGIDYEDWQLQDLDFEDLDPYFDQSAFPPFELAAFLKDLAIPDREHQAIARALAAGLTDYLQEVYGTGTEAEDLLEEYLRVPYVFGYGAVAVVQQPEISVETKLKICQYAVETMNPAYADGIPYGLFTLFGFLAQEKVLSPALFLAGLMAMEQGDLVPFHQPAWMEGVTKEAAIALANWLAADWSAAETETADQVKLWMIWKLSVHCRDTPHLGKALANRWLEQETVPTETKLALCWGWLEDAQEVGTPPTGWQLMDAFMAGDRERMEQICEEAGFDVDELPLPSPEEMPPELAGDEFTEMLLAARRFVLVPPYLKRLAVPALVRLGEKLEEVVDVFWDLDDDYYVDALNQGVADAIEAFPDHLGANELRRLIERGIRHSRSGTRKRFYALSLQFYGDKYLKQAAQDRAQTVRAWADRHIN